MKSKPLKIRREFAKGLLQLVHVSLPGVRMEPVTGDLFTNFKTAFVQTLVSQTLRYCYTFERRT